MSINYEAYARAKDLARAIDEEKEEVAWSGISGIGLPREETEDKI